MGKLLSELISSVSLRAGFPHGNALGRVAQSLILFIAIIIVIDQIGIEVTFLINLISIILAAVLFGGAGFRYRRQDFRQQHFGGFYVRKLYREGAM